MEDLNKDYQENLTDDINENTEDLEFEDDDIFE